MTKKLHYSKLRLQSLLMAIVMVILSCSLFLFSACTNDDDDDDTTKPEATDTQVIKNGDFEYFYDKDGDALIPAPNSWNKSNTGYSSTAASGIIDTNADAWDFIQKGKDEGGFLDKMDKDNETYYDEDVAYYANSNALFTEKDIPSCENPKTHYTDAEDIKENGSHVLMVSNQRDDKSGTAQKYTSATTINVTANTSVTFSVWVKTLDLEYTNGDVIDERGAYINVTQTVAGKTLDAWQVKNINTSNQADNSNNGWVQYSFYLRASNSGNTTFTVVLGLGQGDSSDRYENVNGYAFFDDLTYSVISNDDFDTEVASKGAITCDLSSTKDSKLFDASSSIYNNEYVYSLDLFQDYASLVSKVDVSAPYLTVDSKGYTTDTYKNFNLSSANDYVGVKSLSQINSASNNADMQKIAKDNFDATKFPFDNTDNIIMLYSAKGASYSVKMTEKSNEDIFTLEPNDSLLISFWVKTSSFDGLTGATINLVDGANKSTISSIDTTTFTKVNTDEKKDIFDGWKQCYFFVSNDKANVSAHDFYLTFSYGPTTIYGTTISNYTEGFVAFANFEYYKISNDELNKVSTDSYAVKASLYGDGGSTINEAGFDSVAYSDKDTISASIANTKNYKGVNGGSVYIGGENAQVTNDNAGLINKSYIEKYNENKTAGNWLSALEAIATANNISYTNSFASEWWNKLIGDEANQPLLIICKANASYGFIGNSQSVGTDTYKTISVRVKVSNNGVAYIYLMDVSDYTKGYNDFVKIVTPNTSYWYNSDGNVTKVDPEDDDYSQYQDEIYWFDETTGLFKDSNGNYRANLANYEKDTDGNLVTSDGTIVFYYNESDKCYYRDEAFTSNYKVTDFDHQYSRYTTSSKDLYAVIDTRANGDLANKWITVNFNIVTGNKDKSYRLEVWNGSRDGLDTASKDSYVVYDTTTPGTLSSTYDTLLADVKDNILRDIKATDPTATEITTENYDGIVYYTYSLYDDGEYIPYCEEWDEEDLGNPYYSYNPGSNTEKIAYLTYLDKTSSSTEYIMNTFVNYSMIEVASAEDLSKDTDEEEDDDKDSNTNVWLLVSSIILAIVLLLALVAMLIKKLVSKSKKKDKVLSHYNAKRRRYARQLNLNEDEELDETDKLTFDDDEDISEEDLYSGKVDGEELTEETSDNELSEEAQDDETEEKKAQDDNDDPYKD